MSEADKLFEKLGYYKDFDSKTYEYGIYNNARIKSNKLKM